MTVDDHPPTRFFLMRHAMTVWNRDGRIQGQMDTPLAPEGEKQIEAWRGVLKPLALDLMCSSDLGRARATARGLNQDLALPLFIEPRLREQDWGRWTGRIHRRLRTEDAERYRREIAQGWHFQPPAGESHLQVLERALSALADLAHRPEGQRILVVTHEGVIKCLIYHLAIRDGCGQPPEAMAAYHLHQLDFRGVQLILRRMNAIDLNR
ncbi:MAG: histidine phosphatase family protein [Desulfobacterales bacterium]|nr:histidine phosphatase family protein [Desulfobacterales bacterium]